MNRKWKFEIIYNIREINIIINWKSIYSKDVLFILNREIFIYNNGLLSRIRFKLLFRPIG